MIVFLYGGGSRLPGEVILIRARPELIRVLGKCISKSVRAF